MEVHKAKSYIKRKLKEYGLKCKVDYTNVVDYVGCFFPETNEIKISLTYVRVCNKKIIYDVIKHEIAHAIDYNIRNISFHDEAWKKIAKEVKCNDNRFIVLSLRDLNKIYKYRYSCTNEYCNYAEHKSRLMTKPICKKCGKKLKLQINKIKK